MRPKRKRARPELKRTIKGTTNMSSTINNPDANNPEKEAFTILLIPDWKLDGRKLDGNGSGREYLVRP